MFFFTRLSFTFIFLTFCTYKLILLFKESCKVFTGNFMKYDEAKEICMQLVKHFKIRFHSLLSRSSKRLASLMECSTWSKVMGGRESFCPDTADSPSSPSQVACPRGRRSCKQARKKVSDAGSGVTTEVPPSRC